MIKKGPFQGLFYCVCPDMPTWVDVHVGAAAGCEPVYTKYRFRSLRQLLQKTIPIQRL
jgi:hypothetical protein